MGVYKQKIRTPKQLFGIRWTWRTLFAVITICFFTFMGLYISLVKNQKSEDDKPTYWTEFIVYTHQFLKIINTHQHIGFNEILGSYLSIVRDYENAATSVGQKFNLTAIKIDPNNDKDINIQVKYAFVEQKTAPQTETHIFYNVFFVATMTQPSGSASEPAYGSIPSLLIDLRFCIDPDIMATYPSLTIDATNYQQFILGAEIYS